jgi:hypothetical protein
MEEQNYIGWNGNSQNAQLLQFLLHSAAIPAKWGAVEVQEQYPQFQVYRLEIFTVSLSHYKKNQETILVLQKKYYLYNLEPVLHQ